MVVKRRVYKKKRTNVYRKGNYRGNTRYNPRYKKNVVSKWINPIAQMRNYKMTYAQAGFELACTTVNGNRTYEMFNGNSLYDPYYTGVGAQPYGMDQLMPGLFQLYKVYAAKITVFATLKVPAESTVQSATVTVYPTLEGSLTYEDLPDVRRMPKSRSMCLSTQSHQTGKLSNYVTTRFMYPNAYNDFGMRAQYNSNPSYSWRWVVHASSQREAQPATIRYDVRIKYYIQMSRNTGINES